MALNLESSSASAGGVQTPMSIEAVEGDEEDVNMLLSTVLRGNEVVLHDGKYIGSQECPENV